MRNLVTTVQNQFVGGLISEATGLNFPEKAVFETWNTRYNKKGNVNRRKGINFELTTPLSSAGVASDTVTNFIWRGVGLEGKKEFLVVQSGSTLYFYEADANGDYTNGLKSTSIDLASFTHVNTPDDIAARPCAMASGLGKLFVVHPFVQPFYVVYDDASDDFTSTEYKLYIRDFEGIDEHLADPSVRPTSITNSHLYNLYNQGWWPRIVDGSHDPIQWWTSHRADWPSDCDIWWVYKAPDSHGREVLNSDQINLIDMGNSIGPKGHYIFDAFDVNRSVASGLSLPLEDNSSSLGIRPSSVAFYAGRVFYGGVNTKSYANKVYYTQVIERDAQIGICYQLNDPTAEQLSDLLDTDGGIVQIPDMASCTAMVPVHNSLILLATNGIWTIQGSGADGTGFTATGYSVSKLSTVPCPSKLSLVLVDGYPIFWNYDGIWSITPNDAGMLTVTNTIKNNIQTFFDTDCPLANRIYAQGAYDPFSQVVQWVYRSIDSESPTDFYTYDRLLELNLQTGAYYPFTWDVTKQRIASIFLAGNSAQETVVGEDGVTDSGDDVVDGSSSLVENINFSDIPGDGLLASNPSHGLGSEYPGGAYAPSGTPMMTSDGTTYLVFANLGDDALVFTLDTSTDTVVFKESLSDAALQTLAATGGMTFVDNSSNPIDIADTTVAVIDGQPYFMLIGHAGLLHGKFIYFLLYTYTGGVCTYVGGIREEVTINSLTTPQVWKMAQWTGNSVSDYGIAISTCSVQVNNYPYMWVLPAIDQITTGGANKLITSSIGDSNKWDMQSAGISIYHYTGSQENYIHNMNQWFMLNVGASTRLINYWGASAIQANTSGTGYYSGNTCGYVSAHSGAYPNGWLEYNQWVTNGLMFRLSILDPTNTFPSGSPVIDNTMFQFPDTTPVVPFSDRQLNAGTTDMGIAYGDFQAAPSRQFVDGNMLFIWSTNVLENNTVDMYAGQATYSTQVRGRVSIGNVTSGLLTQTDTLVSQPFLNPDDFGGLMIGRQTGYFYDSGTKKIYGYADVVVGGNPELTIFKAATGATEPDLVTVPIYGLANARRRFEFIGDTSGELSFLEEKDTGYTDFAYRYAGGVDFTSYFKTGAMVRGEGQKRETMEYITVHANQVTDGSFYVQGLWDYANADNSGKWSTPQQGYSVRRPYRDVSHKRLVIRGQGPALQLYVTSESGKPFDIIGWSTTESVDATV